MVARWHRGLGCVVKLPAEFEDLPQAQPDEGASSNRETQPFSTFGDDLGRTIDQLEDWQEDLRILYVACTRASDLLILSAGLPGPLSDNDRLPANHWTLTLEERFDPKTGRCLADEIEPDDAPLVRVHTTKPDENAFPPASATGSVKAHFPRANSLTPRMMPTVGGGDRRENAWVRYRLLTKFSGPFWSDGTSWTSMAGYSYSRRPRQIFLTLKRAKNCDHCFRDLPNHIPDPFWRKHLKCTGIPSFSPTFQKSMTLNCLSKSAE
jgi:hypothetical protein